jgi:hypothetical protein
MFNQQLSRILQRYRDRGQRADRLVRITCIVLLAVILLYVVL